MHFADNILLFFVPPHAYKVTDFEIFFCSLSISLETKGFRLYSCNFLPVYCGCAAILNNNFFESQIDKKAKVYNQSRYHYAPF